MPVMPRFLLEKELNTIRGKALVGHASGERQVEVAARARENLRAEERAREEEVMHPVIVGIFVIGLAAGIFQLLGGLIRWLLRGGTYTRGG